MPYTADADDATQPIESVLAGTAANDFRKLKAKVNNFFLGSGYFLGLKQQTIEAGTTLIIAPATQTDARIMYGHAVNITRNDIAGTGAQVVAAQLSAVLGNNLNGEVKNISVFGAATEAWTGPIASNATLVGLETSVISQNPANTMAVLGFDIVYKDRPDTFTDTAFAIANAGSVGGNRFNANSRAMQITSQPRGLSGARTGWGRGIIFAAQCFDEYFNGSVLTQPVGIDFRDQDGPYGATPDPWIAYTNPTGKKGITSALALAEFQSITWDRLQFTRSYLDSTKTRLVLIGTGNSPTTTPLFAFNYVTNNIELPGSTAGTAPGAASASMRIKLGSTMYYIALTPV